MEMEKKLKRSSVDEIDRISELPESLLLHILSFLDMKEVVRTSVLSKKWEYTWTSIPTLTFEYYNYPEDDVKEKLQPFVIWVNKTLLQCRNNTVRNLRIKFWYMEEFVGDVDLWAEFIARNNIQDMTLKLTGFDFYKLPRSLCQNSSLLSLSLSLSNYTNSLGVEMRWSSLKSLSIESMELDDDIMTKILSATPMLQVLKISKCQSGKVLHIYSNSLQELMIDTLFSEHFIKPLIKISAPNIQSLHILGQLYLGKIRLCSSSLFRAKLDFRFHHFNSKIEKFWSSFMTIIKSILPVVQLEVGFDFLKTFALLGKKSLSLPFSNLTCLKITGSMDITDIVSIICLLKCSPNLEKLVLNKKGYLYKDRNKFLLKLADKYWESKRRMEKFELPYLKTVKFNGFREVNDFTRVLLQLLLENAILIDNIVIDMGEIQMIVTPTSRVV